MFPLSCRAPHAQWLTADLAKKLNRQLFAEPKIVRENE
jgi:hypothetical protein